MTATNNAFDPKQIVKRVEELAQQGVPRKEIAAQLGIGRGIVDRIIWREPVYTASGRSWVRSNPHRAEYAKRALKLRKRGLTSVEIAHELGVAKGTVNRYLRDPSGKETRAASRRYRTGVPLTREEADVTFNRSDLPISKKIRMRPVWQRRQRRIYMQSALPPATDEEKRDAIRVLSDERLCREAPALFFDAFLILDEEGG